MPFPNGKQTPRKIGKANIRVHVRRYTKTESKEKAVK